VGEQPRTVEEHAERGAARWGIVRNWGGQHPRRRGPEKRSLLNADERVTPNKEGPGAGGNAEEGCQEPEEDQRVASPKVPTNGLEA